MSFSNDKGATEISKRLSALQSYLFAQRNKENMHHGIDEQHM